MAAHRFPRDNGQTRKGGRYDRTHVKARAAAAQLHQPTDPCTRCGQPLGPMGPWLHYDHTDDGTAYLGFAHRTCNIRAAAIAGNLAQAATRGEAVIPTRRATRDW